MKPKFKIGDRIILYAKEPYFKTGIINNITQDEYTINVVGSYNVIRTTVSLDFNWVHEHWELDIDYMFNKDLEDLINGK